ncbi:hypothetical protein UPYG_G00087930, partial [Umbra pygmaea]
MSLRSGKYYLKEDNTTQQKAAGEEQQMKVTPQTHDVKSQSSRASTRHSSATSSSATKAYAKAKAAQAQIAFAEREAEMMKQKAELEANTLKQKASFDANLHLLQCQRAAAAAQAEASAFEELEVESGEYKRLPDVEEEPLSTVQRTSEYVQQHSDMFIQEQPSEPKVAETRERKTVEQEIFDIKPEASHGIQINTQPVYKDIKTESKRNLGLTDTYPCGTQRTANPEREYLPEANGAQEFARYLIRKEMVSAGLLRFDDKPENYWAWKASFLSATKDLCLTAREELDLLTKWLGAGSSEQAKRIRAVHIGNPAAGVAMVWQRLEECYGTPEVIEDALLKKIEDFPRLTNRDNVKLRELSDILLELECAKQDGALPGLVYLDTARGVKQIVEKLPYNLQEKWTSFGSKYKEDYRVAFPPFSVFSRFVRQQAKIKNDPSFTLTPLSSHVSPRTEKPTKYSVKGSVAVHKTDITAESSSIQNSTDQKKME